MAEETTFHLLTRRRQELLAQVSALKGQLAPKEAELAQVEKALTVVEPPPASVAPSLPQKNSNAVMTDFAGEFFQIEGKIKHFAEQMKVVTTVSPEALEKLKTSVDAFAAQFAGLNPRYETMTIKELVIQALIDHFPNGGTMMEIRDFIRLGYGRTIEPSSMRPQMHRLKADGILGQDPSTDTWNFRDGKRQLYAMYNHPTSRAAMKELKDDAITPEVTSRVVDATGKNLKPANRNKDPLFDD